jgi:coproporphyrinogen III oxidase-like Fe-S oxidoreductase
LSVASGECWALDDVAQDGQPARARFSHDLRLLDYLRAPLASPGPFELLSAPQTAREDVMLGLRLVRGVTLAAVEAAGLREVLLRLQGEGLVESEGGLWRTTERGWLLGNRVFGAVWNG